MLAPGHEVDLPIVRADEVVQPRQIAGPPVAIRECERGGAVAPDRAGPDLDLLDRKGPGKMLDGLLHVVRQLIEVRDDPRWPGDDQVNGG